MSQNASNARSYHAHVRAAGAFANSSAGSPVPAGKPVQLNLVSISFAQQGTSGWPRMQATQGLIVLMCARQGHLSTAARCSLLLSLCTIRSEDPERKQGQCSQAKKSACLCARGRGVRKQQRGQPAAGPLRRLAGQPGGRAAGRGRRQAHRRAAAAVRAALRRRQALADVPRAHLSPWAVVVHAICSK